METQQLAQVNVSVARAPLDDPTMRGFVFAFAGTADLAARSPGFVWHLRAEPGDETVTCDGRLLVVNVSVWRDYASLHEFAYRSTHGQLLLRRQRWFLPTTQPSTALWWVDAGVQPTTGEALRRLEHLRAHGPSPVAFSLRRQFDASGRALRHGQPVPGDGGPTRSSATGGGSVGGGSVGGGSVGGGSGTSAPPSSSWNGG